MDSFVSARGSPCRVFIGIRWGEPLEYGSLIMHALRERSRKVERKKGQRYSKEFRQHAVDRMNACENIVALARVLGVCRRVLYNWRDRCDEVDPPPTRSRELILRKQ